MKQLKPLVLMQLKDKLDLAYLKSKKATIFKVVLTILKFVLITAVIYLGFYLLDYLRIVSPFPGVPSNLLVVLFTIMFLLALVVCTFGLVQNLYFSKENKLLLTFPATKSEIFTSKLIVYFLYELKRNCFFLLPLFIAYGMINKLPFYYYIWLLLAIVVLTALLVALAALLSIPTMLIVGGLKKVKWLEYTVIGIFTAGVIALAVYVISIIPQDIDLIGHWGLICQGITNFLNKFVKIFVPFVWIVTAVAGTRYGIANDFMTGIEPLYMLAIIAFTALVFVLLYFIVKPLYFKIASSTYEFRKTGKEKPAKYTVTKPFWSAVKKEIILDLRTTERFWSLMFTTIGLPIAIFLLNKIYAALNTRLMGEYMVITFNIAIILLFSLSTNAIFSHIYSEEGSVSYLAKVSPKPYIEVLFPKMVVNLTLNTLSILVSVSIFASMVGFEFWVGLMIFLIIETTYLAHAFWSAELDVMNPQTSYYKTSGTHIANPNEVKSTMIAFLISAIVALLVFFFLQEGGVWVWFKVLFIAAILLAIRLWLYINTIKVYYKERE